MCRGLGYDPNSQDMLVFEGLPLIARINWKGHEIVNNETTLSIRLQIM